MSATNGETVPIIEAEEKGPEKTPEQEKKQEEAKGNTASSDRVEISIVHQNGQVMMQGPGNPIVLMMVMGKALVAAASEYLAIAAQTDAGMILKPGQNVNYGDPDFVRKVRENA